VPFLAARIVASCGAAAHEVVARYVVPGGRQVTTYDTRTSTLHRAVAPLLPAEAARQPDVEAWLRELAGGYYVDDGGDAALTMHTLLLDWLATVHRLDRATTALYLRGDPDAGKTLFARGVAAMWSDAPVSFKEATGQFNAGLLKCPIVHLSEGVDGGRFASAGASAAFRALVGDRSHRIEAKYEAVSTLIGHPRVIVGANNDDALPIGAGHHTRDDLDAIARRVLYLRASARAAELLREVPPHRLARWAAPGGAIPRHVAWLRETRGEAALERAGSRFLVEGREAGWHRALLLRSGGNETVLSAVVEAVARHARGAILVEPRPNGDGVVVAEAARVWVNVSKLHRAWKALVDEDGPKPTRAQLARTIRDLSPSDRSRTQRLGSGRTAEQARCWDLPGDLVLRVAEAHGVDSLEGPTGLRAILTGMAPAGAGRVGGREGGRVGVGTVGAGAGMVQGGQGPRGGSN
jgi:hypothetical protein